MRHRRRGLLWILFLLAVGLGGGAQAQEVTLPLPAYEALRARAAAEPPPPPDPPTGLAFEEAKLRVEVGETSARVITELTLYLFSEEWQSLPLPATGTFVKADLGTLDGLLQADGEPSLRLRGTGRHRLRLEAVVPVEKDEAATRPTWNLRLALPRAAVVSGEVIVAATVDEVVVDGEALVTRTGEAGRWRLTGLPGATVGLRLAAGAQVPERSELPLRFEATAATALEISRARAEVDLWIQARVRQGRLETLVVPIPDGLELVDVQKEDAARSPESDRREVLGWKVDGGKAVVDLARPVEDGLTLHFRLTGPPPAAAAGALGSDLTSPLLWPEGAERVKLFTQVSVRGDGLLSLVDAGSGRRLDERQQSRLPQGFQQESGLAMAVQRPEEPPRWQVSWAESTEVLAAQVDRLIVSLLVDGQLAGDGGRAFYQLWAQVRSTGAATLSIRPPVGLELAACQRDGADFTPGEDSGSLVLPLRTAGGTQLLYLAGFLPLALPEGKQRFEVPLPAFSAPVSRVGVRVLLPENRFASLAEKGRRGAIGSLPSPPSEGSQPSLALELFGRSVEASGLEGLADALLPAPPGFWSLEATWSALSATPSPLVLELDEQRLRKEWF